MFHLEYTGNGGGQNGTDEQRDDPVRETAGKPEQEDTPHGSGRLLRVGKRLVAKLGLRLMRIVSPETSELSGQRSK